MKLEPTTKSILLVDNDEDLVDAVRSRLEHAGYQCATATTGGEAFVTFCGGLFDLVITDLNMPGIDGIGLVEQIRADSVVPIIVITGYPEAYREQIRRLPQVSILPKPFATDVLLDMVEAEIAVPRAAGEAA